MLRKRERERGMVTFEQTEGGGGRERTPHSIMIIWYSKAVGLREDPEHTAVLVKGLPVAENVLAAKICGLLECLLNQIKGARSHISFTDHHATWKTCSGSPDNNLNVDYLKGANQN